MDKIFSIAFKINGELSGSFGAAISAAQKQMQNLNRRMSADNQRAMTRMAKLQQDLMRLSSAKAAIEQYKALKNSVQDSSAALVQARLKSAQLKQEYQDQYNQVERMRQSYDRLKAVYKENKRTMSADQQSAMQSQIRAAKDELKAQEQILADSKKRWQGSESKSFKLGEQLSRQRSELASLQAALRSAGTNLSDMAAQESRLRAEIERTTAALERQQHIDNRRARFNDAQANLSNATSNFQDAVSTAGTIMSPIKAAVDEAVSFEAAMSKIKALTQVKNIRAGDVEKVNREMGELQETIMRIGAATEFTNLEVAGAAQKYAMSGWSKDQIVGALPTTIDIATATGEKDLIKVGDYLSDEMQALGLMKGSPQEVAKNMQHYGDLMTYALTQSNNDLESFHQAMKYFAPVGTQLGMKPEEMVAAVMTQADAGIKGSMGGTSMRMASLRMFAPPKAAMKALGEMGELSSDAQKGLAEAAAEWEKLGVSEDADWLDRMRALKDASKTMSKTDFMAKLSKITGVNAVSGQSSLLADFEKFESRLTEMTDGTVGGWAQDTAAVMRDNTDTQFKLLDSAVSALATTFGSLFLPALTQGVQMLTNFTSGLQQWVQEHQTAAQWIGIIAAGLSTMIVLAAGAATAFAAWTFVTSGIVALKNAILGLSIVQRVAAGASMAFAAAQTVVNAVMMMNPVGLAVAAFLALGAAILYVVNCCPNLSAALSAAWNDPQGAIHGFTTLLKSSIDSAVNYVVARWETLKSALSHPIDAVLNFMDHGDVIGGKVQAGESGSSGGGSFGTPQTIAAQQISVEAPQVQMPEVPQLETPFANAEQVNQSLSNFAESGNQAGQAAQMFNAEVTNSQAALSANNASLNENNAALSATSAGLNGFNGALASTNGGLAALASSSSSAAGAISGLGSAASSAVSALQSAGANAAAAVSAAAANVGKPAANYAGGIYSKGAFLTTFAEKSPEAAIPIDKSQRATDLWTRTGQLLGLLPGKSFVTQHPAPSQKMTTLEQAQKRRLEQVKVQYEAAKKHSTQVESPMKTLPQIHSTQVESAQREFPRSIFSGQIQNPMPDIFRPTQNYDLMGDILGALREKIPASAGGLLDVLQEKLSPSEGIIPPLINNLPQSQAESAPIDLHFEINIAGNANAEDVEQGIRQTIPLLEETFEQKIANYRHEQQRRAF